MMTLDEAIKHAEWCSENSCGECADEHRQLAEWLRELRERQGEDAEMEDERNLLFERLGNCREALTDARAENEKYRELIRILDHDWNIEVSWDGLRKFWYVGLTEKGVAERDEREAENERLEELLLDLFCLCFPQNFEWEVTNHAWEKYLPCKRCEEAHGGKSPCASTSKDLAEECCKPFQAVVIAGRMRELGIEVDE